ncbi:chitin deacetylase 7-like isoform X1 [Amblyomma americanum]
MHAALSNKEYESIKYCWDQYKAMERAARSLLFALTALCASDVVRCAECDPSRCRLEDNCLCVSTKPPGNLTVAETPQFVMITFDDAVNDQNMDFYRELLAPGRRRNRANGCNMAATFFVSAGYTDYSFVHELHSAGSEIALHSITHLDNMTYWLTLDSDGWETEFAGVRHLMRDYALIPERDMVGARAPFLRIGPGDAYAMMRKQGFLYDSSVFVRPDKLPQYPYTLDYGVQNACGRDACPSGAYNGLWLVPMNMIVRKAPGEDGAENVCAMPDECLPKPTTAPDTFDFLRSNFERFYHTNRAPFPLFIHEHWLWDPQRKQGFLSFVDWLLGKEDVFLTTVQEVVHFMRGPQPLGKYSQKKCSRVTQFQPCPEVHTCIFPDSLIEETNYLVGCKPCPKKYPWIEDVVLEAGEQRAKPNSAKESSNAVSVVLVCCALAICLCVVVEVSVHYFGGGRRKRLHKA